MKKKVVMILCFLILLVFLLTGYLLFTNKTFFKESYLRVDQKEMFIPKYSYFKDECCMTAATFYSFRFKKNLDYEIKHYMDDFDYFEDETTYGYQKKDLFIQSYLVEDHFFYRKIIIVY